MKLTKEEIRSLVSGLNWLKGYTERQNDRTRAHETVLALEKVLGEAALREIAKD